MWNYKIFLQLKKEYKYFDVVIYDKVFLVFLIALSGVVNYDKYIPSKMYCYILSRNAKLVYAYNLTT